MQLLERGIYLPHVLDGDGYHFLVVVDSRHRVIQRRRLFNLSEVDEQTTMLKRWLDTEDPQRAPKTA